MIVYLAELRPALASSGAEQVLRFSSDPRWTRADGVDWLPTLAVPYRRNTQIFDGQFQNQPQDYGQLEVAISKGQNVTRDALTTMVWDGRPVKIWKGLVGQNTSAMQLVFDGTSESVSGKRNRMIVKLSGPNVNIPLLKTLYAGTGGAEGPADLKNAPKPLLLGTATNLEPQYVNRSLGIFQYHGYGAAGGVTAVYDSGSQLGTSIGDYADYAALAAAVVPAGRYATCNALGMGRHGGDITGILTVDAQGAVAAGLPGAIIKWVLRTHQGLSAAKVKEDSLDWLDAQLPYPQDAYVTDQIDTEEFCRQLMLSLGGYVWWTEAGQFTIGLVRRGGSPVSTLGRLNIQDTPQLRETNSPLWKRSMGWGRSWRVHSYSEVRTPKEITPRGTWSASPSPVYQYYDMVDWANASWIYVASVAGNTATPGTDAAVWQYFRSNGAAVVESTTTPSDPQPGVLWRNPTTGVLKTYLSGTWVTLADVTGLNVAAAIAGQGSGATANNLAQLNAADNTNLDNALLSGGYPALNVNANFVKWTNPTGAPDGWFYTYGSASYAPRVATASGNIYDVTVPASAEHEISQYLNDTVAPGFFTIEAEIEFVSGNWRGSGIRFYWFDSSWTHLGSSGFQFADWPDINGNVLGETPTPGKYFFKRTLQIPHATAAKGFVGVSGAGLSVAPSATASHTKISLAAVRPATDGEIVGLTLRPAEAGANVTAAHTAAAISGQGPGATASATQVMNNRLENGVIRVGLPQGGSSQLQSGSAAGAWKIRLPTYLGDDDAMVRFFVDVYEYVSDKMQTYEVGGYTCNSAHAWLNYSARMIGGSGAARPVKFGRDADGYWSIWIGDAGGSWSYPAVTVRDVQVSYSLLSLSRWETGWVVSLETAAPHYVTATVANPNAGDAVFGVNALEGWGGAVATLPNFKTNLGTAAAIAGQAATATSSDFAVVTGTTRPEDNADVTLLVTGSRTAQIAYDHTGTVKSGQLPLGVAFKMVRGSSTDVTSSSTWSAALLSGTATFTIGSSTGVLNVTALSTDAVIEVSGVYGGRTRKGTLTLVRDVATPPTGGYSASVDVSGTVTTSYGSSSTGTMQVRTGASGQVACNAPISFTKVTTGTTAAYGKWQWRAVGGSWADITTEIVSSVSAVKTGGAEPTNDPGQLDVTMTKTGLSANTIYEFQLLVRGASGSIDLAGSASTVGS